MRAAKSDLAQSAIMHALRDVGAAVTSLHRCGMGVPDLLVSYSRRWYLLEVKTITSAGNKASRPNKMQQEWIDQQCAPVHVVHSVDEALTAIGISVNAGWKAIL